MTDRTLPPLPPADEDIFTPSPKWKADKLTAYALTALAPLEAENADLKIENASLYSLLADIRAAVGDNGKRMQEELVEWLREVAANHRRYGFVRQHWGRIIDTCDGDTGDVLDLTIVSGDMEDWDTDPESLDRAIDTALLANATNQSVDANEMGGGDSTEARTQPVYEDEPYAWTTFSALTGQPVFSQAPPDDPNVAGWEPLYRRRRVKQQEGRG